MTSRQLVKFVVTAAVVAVLLHGVVAVAASTAMRVMYPHRIYNVRAWSDEGTLRYRLVGSFLREHVSPDSPVVAFVGSSVTYGYPWAEPLVFSRLFANARPDATVVNASIVAADITGINDWVICAARRNNVRLRAVVLEIPVVNTTAHFIRLREEGRRGGHLAACEAGETDPGYLRLAVTEPRGLGWFTFLSRTDAAERIESPIRLVPVPDDYFASAEKFASIREEYALGIKRLLNNALQVADTVYAFPSPVFIAGLAEIGRDPLMIAEQLAVTDAACAEVPGVRCLDTARLWADRSLYINLTHLNQAGHRATADLMLASVDGPSRRPTDDR
jgi:hypothetical protein